MLKLKTLHNLILLLFITIINYSCCTNIKSIEKHSNFYNGKTVRIKGKVTSSLELNDVKIFVLKNKKGHKIYVVTNNILPIYGEKIKIKGTVNKAFKYKKNSKMLVVIDKKQPHNHKKD